MFGLTGIRLGGALAVVVAIIAALTWLVSTVRDRDRLKALDDGHHACVVALRGGPKADPDLTACEPEIAAAAHARDAGIACDRGLSDITGASDYVIRMTCSEPVKTLQANLVTVTANNADLGAQLVTARAGLAAAVTRGEARAAAANVRTRNAQDALARAPVGADGLARCNGECLRVLAGDAPVDAAPRP